MTDKLLKSYNIIADTTNITERTFRKYNKYGILLFDTIQPYLTEGLLTSSVLNKATLTYILRTAPASKYAVYEIVQSMAYYTRYFPDHVFRDGNRFIFHTKSFLETSDMRNYMISIQHNSLRVETVLDPYLRTVDIVRRLCAWSSQTRQPVDSDIAIDACYLMLHTGMRPCEVRRLTRKDLCYRYDDAGALRINIPHAKARHLTTRSKLDNKPRITRVRLYNILPQFTTTIVDQIQDYRSCARDKLVFKISHDRLNDQCKVHLGLTVKCLRTIFATSKAELGWEQLRVSHIMGHATSADTAYRNYQTGQVFDIDATEYGPIVVDRPICYLENELENSHTIAMTKIDTSKVKASYLPCPLPYAPLSHLDKLDGFGEDLDTV